MLLVNVLYSVYDEMPVLGIATDGILSSAFELKWDICLYPFGRKNHALDSLEKWKEIHNFICYDTQKFCSI